ncbi:cytochrome P450 [Aurantimonas aggregata]|uniref:Cytochrome P450 n=1 Tax=Aurantimonas aggregata TaxID=2047720 RepID=A0A6L9MHS5_9HYPH|nr:cytochrome P450 [Aurantimonas aggregata]NDV87020.1 cytochrome P450 [Aurantimonas aggregata]
MTASLGGALAPDLSRVEGPADGDGVALPTESFDLRALPAVFHDDPYRTYRALRDTEPVKRLPDGQGVFLTRHADCLAVYKDTRLFTSSKSEEFRPKFGATPLYEHHTTSLVFNDAPLHTRVRKIIAGALTPRAIAAMEDGLRALIGELVDRLREKAADGQTVDLIEDFAAAIPVEIIGNLLAVPHAERGPLRDWSLAILGALEPVLTDAQLARGNAAVTEFIAYLTGLVAERRMNPGDPATDVLTRLIEGEAGGETLSASELLQNCIFILNAGHETTTNMIGNALVLLSEWPQERTRLIADPSLMRTAVEEVLRFESSNQLGNRAASEDCEIGETPIQAGTSITLCIGAANRDPQAFADPDRFDVGRQPNRHLAFGMGPHQCAGMNLARLEGRIALEMFLAAFPDYRLAGPPVRGGRVRFRGYQSIPAELTPQMVR